jgi:exodeoxyribonuclease-3
MPALKIASWNINSVRARAPIVEKLLVEDAPDILCLQETKVCDDDFPQAMFRKLGYKHIVICGQRMHHGVAIISRVPMVEEVRHDWQANGEARHVGVRLESGIRLEKSTCRRAATFPTASRTRSSDRSSTFWTG